MVSGQFPLYDGCSDHLDLDIARTALDAYTYHEVF